MRSLIMIGCMLSAFSAFAQIDDIINKPKPPKTEDEKSMLYHGGNLIIDAAKYLSRRLSEIEISSLVDEMERDGVKERRFIGTIGVKGALIHREDLFKDEDGVGILNFNIKVSADEKVFVSASLIERHGDFERAADKRELNILKEVKLLTFILDKGMEFRDLERIGLQIASVDLMLPLKSYSSQRYIGIIAGADLGSQKTTITMMDGSELVLGGTSVGTRNQMAFAYNLRTGLELKEKLGKGNIQLSGIFHFSQQMAELEVDYMTNDSYWFRKGVRTQAYLKPELKYSHSIGKKQSVSVGVGANIMLRDNVTVPKGTYTPVELGDRNRQPYKASLIINF